MPRTGHGAARYYSRRHAVVLVLAAAALGLAAAQSERRVAPPAQFSPERRLALIVGNDAYADAPLRNAVNDARAVAAALRDLGFEVTEAINATEIEMRRAVDRFVNELRAGDVALFYYAGHGFQLGGDNYLAPTDFRAADKAEAAVRAYSATLVQDRISDRSVSRAILILDACRANAFAAARSPSEGWAAMGAGRGTFIALATGPGQIADDNLSGTNGLYTTHLLQVLRQPGLSLDDLFNRVGAQVEAASGRRQTPWKQSSAGVGSYVLRAAPPAAAAAASSSGDLGLQAELALWDAIKNSRDAALFEDYLRRYPDGQFRAVAESYARELRAASKPKPDAANPSEPRPPAGAAARRAGDVRSDPKVPGLQWAYIPAGTFQMGCVPGDLGCQDDEKPRHQVTLVKPFELMTTEVTLGMFRQFVQATGHRTTAEREGASYQWRDGQWILDRGLNWRSPGFPQDERHPVVDVSWDDAQAFCEWAGGRLPGEVEWEYAARGGEDTWIYVWGTSRLPLLEGPPAANVADESMKRKYPNMAIINGYDDGYVETAPAGFFPANKYGLYDMAGNVWEWVAEWYDAKGYVSDAVTDPSGPVSGQFRVVRGGSWGIPRGLRVSDRGWSSPLHAYRYGGIRCARGVSP